MKKLAFGALFTGLLSVVAACGGGDSAPDAPDLCVGDNCVDGGGDVDATPPLACNPVAQTGCEADQKCTWITVLDGTEEDPDGVGLVGCVDNGAVAIGDACTSGEPGETTGFDNCARGGYCIAGTCQEICTDAPDSCDSATSACGRYTGVFNDTNPVIGVCDFKCDPVDQTRLFDDAANCGGTLVDPDGDGGNEPFSNRACYGYVDIDFTCAPAFNPTFTHYFNVPMNQRSLNACAPGYGLLPLAIEGDANAFMCMAYCRPGPSAMGSTTNLNGVAPFTCASRGATLPANECRYWTWFDVIFGATGEPNPDNETYGFCIDYARHGYNHDNNTGTANIPFPSCTTLASTDTDENGFPDNEEWGCSPQVTPSAATGESFRNLVRKRLGVTNQPVAPAFSK